MMSSRSACLASRRASSVASDVPVFGQDGRDGGDVFYRLLDKELPDCRFLARYQTALNVLRMQGLHQVASDRNSHSRPGLPNDGIEISSENGIAVEPEDRIVRVAVLRVPGVVDEHECLRSSTPEVYADVRHRAALMPLLAMRSMTTSDRGWMRSRRNMRPNSPSSRLLNQINRRSDKFPFCARIETIDGFRFVGRSNPPDRWPSAAADMSSRTPPSPVVKQY
jgi:hypothetical protein